MKHPSEPRVTTTSSFHPEMEDLIDYYQGQLDSPSAERIRDHLDDCPECMALVLDLEDFIQAESTPPAPEEVTEARLVARAVTWEVRAERWRNAGLIAASLFLAASVPLGIYFWNHGQQPSSAVAGLTPEANVPSASLYPRSALRGARENRLDIPRGARWVHVVLTTEELMDGEGYQAVIEDSAGREVLALDGLRPTSVGMFSLGLPAARLKSGNYGLRLFRPSGGKRTLIHEYPLKIVVIEAAASAGTPRQESN